MPHPDPSSNFHESLNSTGLPLEGADMQGQPSSHPETPSKHLLWADPHRAVWPRCSLSLCCSRWNILAMAPARESHHPRPQASVCQSAKHPNGKPERTADGHRVWCRFIHWKLGTAWYTSPTKAAQWPKKGPCAMAKKRDQYSRRCRHTSI